MYLFLNYLHIITSSLFVFLALFLSVRSLLGWLRNYTFKKMDRLLAKSFLVLLYVSLILGFLLFFWITPFKGIDPQNYKEAVKRASLRFWAVEHLYSMTFALIFSQIGLVFIKKSISDKNRFAYSAFYNGVATFITILSMTFYMIYR